MRVPVVATAVATALVICAAPAALADEGIPDVEGSAHSVAELSKGESITVPHGYNIGLVEDESSLNQNFRSANTAPSCVQAKVEKVAIQVYNNCGSDMRVKVIMTANTSPVLGAKDSACKTVAAGTRANVRWIIRGQEKVDRVEQC